MFVAASVARTVTGPAACAAGTVNTTLLNVPFASVVTGAGVVATVAAPNLTVMADRPAKPWPVTATVLPAATVGVGWLLFVLVRPTDGDSARALLASAVCPWVSSAWVV